MIDGRGALAVRIAEKGCFEVWVKYIVYSVRVLWSTLLLLVWEQVGLKDKHCGHNPWNRAGMGGGVVKWAIGLWWAGNTWKWLFALVYPCLYRAFVKLYKYACVQIP